MLDNLLSTNKITEAQKLMKEIHELCKTSPLNEVQVCSVLNVLSMAQMYLHLDRNAEKLFDFILIDVYLGGSMEQCAKIAMLHVLKGDLK